MKNKTQKKGAAGDEKHPCKRNRCKKLSGDNNLQFCQKHYNFHIKFFTNKYNHLLESETPDLAKMEEDLQSLDDQSLTPPNEQRCWRNDGVRWRCKNFRMRISRGADDDSGTLDTKYCERHYNYNKNRRLKKKSEDDSESDFSNSDIETRDSNCLKRWRLAEEDDHTCSDRIIEDGSAKIGTKRRKLETTESFGELKSSKRIREPVVKLESLELEKNEVEFTTLQGKYAGVETRNTTAGRDEDATEYWRNKFSELESRFLKMENENSTMRCVVSNLESIVLRLENKDSTVPGCGESRISKLESLVLRMENGKSTMGCFESRISKLESLVLRMEDENSAVAGCLEFRVSNLESLVLRNGRNEDKEIKWKFEADMLSSFEEDLGICMKAVCALYRQHISEDEISAKGLFHYSDALRGTTLAKFLMDGACKGDLQKSVKELEEFDSKAVEDCKRDWLEATQSSYSVSTKWKRSLFSSYYKCQPWR